MQELVHVEKEKSETDVTVAPYPVVPLLQICAVTGLSSDAVIWVSSSQVFTFSCDQKHTKK